MRDMAGRVARVKFSVCRKRERCSGKRVVVFAGVGGDVGLWVGEDIEPGEVLAEDADQGEGPVRVAGGADGDGVVRAGGRGGDLGEGAVARGGGVADEARVHGEMDVRIKTREARAGEEVVA
jgi:hypothetical protein